MNNDNQIYKHWTSGLNMSWISEHLKIGRGEVRDSIAKSLALEISSKRDAQPLLDNMSRDEQIVALAEYGLSAQKIVDKLKLDLSAAQAGRVIKQALGERRSQSRSAEYALENVRPYVVACLERLGKDPLLCESCLEPQTSPCDIHHTKYEGATIYDLMYVCRSCNLARENKGLS